MEVEFEAKPVPIKEISRGSLICVDRRGVTMFAIKAFNAEQISDEANYLAYLGPFDAESTPAVPYFQKADPKRTEHVLELARARVVPKLESRLIRLGWQDDPAPGALAFAGDQAFIALGEGTMMTGMVNAGTGAYSRNFPSKPAGLAWLSEWSIFVPRFGKATEIFHFRAV